MSAVGVSTKPFRSLDAHALLTVLLLGFGLVFDLVLLALSGLQIGALSVERPDLAAYNEGASFAGFSPARLFAIRLLLYFATGVCFLAWLHRAYGNLRSLGARQLDSSPGWAVVSFFIPILNLFRPYQIVRETWRHSHPALPAGQITMAQSNNYSTVIVGW